MKHGKITNVRFKKGVPLCDVKDLDRVDNEYEDVPVSRIHRGVFMVPEVGQEAQILEISGQRFIIGILERNDEGHNPSLKQGEMAFQLDKETYVRFIKNGSGGYDIDLNASGTINIDGAENVFIDGIDFDQHTHDYVDDEIADTGDGSGAETAQNKTTDPPK